MLGVASAVLIALLLVPGGPLAFLPPILAVPLALAPIAGWMMTAGRGFRPALDLGGAEAPPCRRFAAPALEILGLTLVLGSYLLLKLIGLHPSGTDDNIYFYLAFRMAQGAVPYRDFFFAHPPVHLLVPALVFGVSGFSIGVAKTIPALAQGLGGVFLYLALRRTSRPLALVALLLHLTAYEVLMGSTDMNGENLMTLFLFAGVLASMRGRHALAGALAGLGLGCGLYALAAVLALAVATAFGSRRAAVRFGLGLLGTFGGVMLVFAILGGHGFFEGVFWYHFAKPVKGSDRLPVFASANPFAMAGALAHNLVAWLKEPTFKRSLYYHAPQFVGLAIAAVGIGGRALVAWWSPRPDRSWQSVLTPRDLLSGTPLGWVKFCTLAVVLFNLQWAAVNEVYDFYLVPMIVFASVPAAWTLVAVYEGVRDSRRARDAVLPALAAAAFCLQAPWAASLNRELWPEEQRDAGQAVRYEWREPWALSGLSGLSRTLFFEEQRIKGDVTPYYRHYVWNKLLTFSTVDDIADHVRATTTPDETLIGASTLAPLVALYAGRRLAGDEADTNGKRFSSGVLTDEQLLEKACTDNVRYVVVAGRSHFSDDLMASNPALARTFAREQRFVDPQLLHRSDFPITLYRRNDLPGLPAGRVCEAR